MQNQLYLQHQVVAPPKNQLCSGGLFRCLGRLPGGASVFSRDNIAALLRGENRISPITEEAKKRFLDKNIVRVSKNAQTDRVDSNRFHKPSR